MNRIFYDGISDLPSGGGEQKPEFLKVKSENLFINIVPHDDKNWYPCFCDACGWFGSSEHLLSTPIADTGDYTDPQCPVCFSICEGGADNDFSMVEIFESIHRSWKHIIKVIDENTKLQDESYSRQSEIESLKEQLKQARSFIEHVSKIQPVFFDVETVQVQAKSLLNQQH